MDDGVEAIIGTTLRRYYLVRKRSSFLRIVREIRAECEAKGFRAPTRKTIKARLDIMDQREVPRKRKGAKEADKVFAARPGRLEVARPLEIVQIDHTPADIILVDHVHRRPLGGDAGDGYDVVVAAIPGVGWSEAPDTPESLRTPGAWFHTLMTDVLDYESYVIHGSDQSAITAAYMGVDYPEAVEASRVLP